MRVRREWLRFAALVVLLAALMYLLFRVAPLVWSVGQIIILVTLVSLALNPAVRWQEARGIPRWAGVINLFLLLVVGGALLLWVLLPPFISQLQMLLAEMPQLWGRFAGWFNGLLARYPVVARHLDVQRTPLELLTGLRSYAALARTVFATTVGAVTAVVLVTITTVFTLLDPWPLLYGVRGLFPRDWWPTLERLASRIATLVQRWVVGIGTLAVIIGVMDYLGLALINLFYGPNLPFVLFFAILGALLEVVPVVGPILATVLPTLVGLSIDPLLGLLVLALFITIQQIENNVIVPLVLHRAVALHPVSLLLSLVVMSGLLGLFGAMIAVPVAAVLKVVYDDWYYPLLHRGEHPRPAPTAQEEMRHEQEHAGRKPEGEGE